MEAPSQEQVQALQKDPSIHYWHITLLDGPDSGTLRTQNMPLHKKRIAEFRVNYPGVQQFGGPVLDSKTYSPIGSTFILKRTPGLLDSLEDVQSWIEQDAYWQNGVWKQKTIYLFAGMTRPKAS